MSDIDQGQFPAPNPNQGVEAQLPHSGVDGHELPVTEFDNTTLKDAVEQGLVTIPESPAALTEPTRPEPAPATAPSARTESGRGKKLGLIAGGAAAVAAIGGIVGFTAGKGGESDSSNTLAERPAATAAPSPTASVETDPGAPVVIPATEAPEPVQTSVAPSTTQAPETTTVIETGSEPNIIKAVDVEGMVADGNGITTQEELDEMLAAISRNLQYGYDNDSMAHLQLAVNFESSSGTAANIQENLQRINDIGGNYRFGVKYLSAGEGGSWLENGYLYAPVGEFINNKGSMAEADWVEDSTFIGAFKPVEQEIIGTNGQTQTVTVWKFAGRVSQ